MSADLLPVWSEIEKYLDNGISVIPVRDKDDDKGLAKTPFGNWKEYQKKIVSKEVLFDLMDVKYNTTAVAIVCGLVSKMLEVLDIDVKYKIGIDAILFTDLKTLYPEIFAKLRIHKTPSGGYHILYRCEEPVPGNQKLAGYKNDKGKIINFLETRGEGGYVLAPPALGYSVVKDAPIPVLTVAERESLISLCRSYNEIIKVENTYKPTHSDNNYYDTNPFEDFNNRVDPNDLMNELSWKYFKGNNHFLWYTRPGKDKGVSMSFNLQKRFFFCFTASTDLEENKGYSPANLYALLKHGSDKKLLFNDLVSKGYGKIKPKVEQQIAKRAATNGKQLPANISTEAKEAFDQISTQLNELHPYGIFWLDLRDKGVIIDRELLYRVADNLGFKLYNDKLIQSDGNYIEEVTDRFFFDTLKQYIQEEDADLYRDICNAYEAFIEKHGKFTISRLPLLNEQLILKDTVDTCYKIYSNGILEITANTINLLPSIPKLIWRNAVRPRPYCSGKTGKYLDFLKLAIDYITNSDYLLNCIGFLTHEYKDETTGYIIVLTEQCENPEDGGGAGKNVFSELFKNITSFISKPGSQSKLDEKFMQSWDGSKIFCIADVPKNFDFSFLKELSTGAGLMKKLFKDERQISSDKMPKFLIQTNYSYKITDGGLKRRIRQIEFTDFFTKTGGVNKYFDGVYFPNGWDEDDWAGYDTLMATAVQHWIKNGRSIPEAELSVTGWQKQFEQDHGEMLSSFIKENIEVWVAKGFVNNKEFNECIDRYLNDNKANQRDRARFTSFKINAAFRYYCSKNSIDFKSNINDTKSLTKDKGRKFTKDEDPPF